MADVSDQNSKPVEDGEGVSWAEPEEESQAEAEEAGLLESREVVAPLTRDALNSEELKTTKSKFHVEDGKFPIQQTKFYLYIVDDPQWAIMLLLSHLLYWIWGFPVYEEFGYADFSSTTLINTNEDGQLVSGPSGSGVFPIAFLCMIAGTFIFCFRLFMYDAQKMNPEIQVLGLSFFFGSGKTQGYD